MFTVDHDPDGHSCNMGWRVLNGAGGEVSRGPEWAVRAEVRQRNNGTFIDPLERRAKALIDILTGGTR